MTTAPLLLRDVADILAVSVTDLAQAAASLGLGEKSPNMAVTVSDAVRLAGYAHQHLAKHTEGPVDFHADGWYLAESPQDMRRFYQSILPRIREAARILGYAVGEHGSMLRDMDLIAVPWGEWADTPDALAHAIADAACGISRASSYDWEQKPAGRVATSIPVCFPGPWAKGIDGAGHIDLSVIRHPSVMSSEKDAMREALGQLAEAVGAVACIQHFKGDKGRLFFLDDVSPPPGSDFYIRDVTWTLLAPIPDVQVHGTGGANG